MKFKVGQKWRSRRGADVFEIVRIDEGANYPVKAARKGAVRAVDYITYSRSFTAAGEHVVGETGDLDLVELIEECWIAWTGGTNPVPGSEVEYQMRTWGTCASRSDNLRWNHLGFDGDILRYRVVVPAPAAEDPSTFSVDAPGDYVTREGLKVRVLCVDRKGSDYPVVGVVLRADGYEEVETWLRNGSTLLSPGSNADIVGKWTPFADLPIDAPVWVRSSENHTWMPQHFAGVVDGKPAVWPAGTSSHTCISQRQTRYAEVVTTKPEGA